MKKTKIEQRIENAFDAFFDDENLSEPNALTFAGNQEIGQIFSNPKKARTADKYFDWFKKLFAFLPGVLILHFAVFALLEFGIFGIWGLFWIAAGVFMVWAGIGNLTDKKHFLLPLSVISVSFIFALPVTLLPVNLADIYVYFYICILPLLFITPILTKNYLDKETK